MQIFPTGPCAFGKGRLEAILHLVKVVFGRCIEEYAIEESHVLSIGGKCVFAKKQERPPWFPKEVFFSGKGTRTPDRTDMSRLLYQLSYAAITTLAL